MAESIIQVAPDSSGKKLHTNSYTVGANTVEDEFTVPGEFPYATYSVVTDGAVALATANSHLLQITAGASLKVRIRRITISPFVPPAAVNVMEVQIVRLTTAGTGGTAKTARKYDTADAAAGAAGQTLPTVKGTETDIIWTRSATWGTAAIPVGYGPVWEWVEDVNSKSIVIPAGTANGIAIKNITGVATATCLIAVELVETAF